MPAYTYGCKNCSKEFIVFYQYMRPCVLRDETFRRGGKNTKLTKHNVELMARGYLMYERSRQGYHVWITDSRFPTHPFENRHDVLPE